jgi:hypothetical protein
MSTMLDTEARLADALRVLLPFAIVDEPEWAPKDALVSRRLAYANAALALHDYDEAQGRESRVIDILPGATADPTPLALVA